MPKKLVEIESKLCATAEEAASHLRSFGISGGAPRAEDMLFKGRTLLWDALTDSERGGFSERYPYIGRAFGGLGGIECKDIEKILEEAKRCSRDMFHRNIMKNTES